MEAKHKQFIRRKLIPFILREHGRGFTMYTWVDKNNAPGTVACIGGSVCVLKNARTLHNDGLAKRSLGLTSNQASALFYGWQPAEDITDQPTYRWPTKFIREFARRRTAWGKARVAARLLQEVAKTNGKCLEQSNG